MSESVHYLILRCKDTAVSAAFAFAVVNSEHVTVYTLDQAAKSPSVEDRVSKTTMSTEAAREVYIECLRQGAVRRNGAVAVGSANGFGVSGVGLASLVDAETWRDEYYKSYHPAGYGTRVHFVDLGDSMVAFRYQRANSCD